MKTATNLDPTSVLSASELVLLNGEQFAKKVMIGNIELLHSAEKVSAAQLGQAIIVSAFLASERAGAIQLEIREKKALLGLRKAKGLYAAPAEAIEWPNYSLEVQISSIAASLVAQKGANEVANIVYAWLREDSGSPWQSAIELVKAGMAERGLLHKLEQKKLKVFTVTKYQLPEKTAVLAHQMPIQPVQQLLQDCENRRPELWKMLVKQVESAIKSRTEQSDIDFD